MQKKSVPSASGAARAAIRTGCKFALAAVAMSLSATCLAVTNTFPSTGRDIASAADWGGTLPGTGDRLRFATSATVTASNDVEFAGLFVGGGTAVVLDMRDAVSGGSPRRIKMNGPAYIPENAWNAKYTLRGGFWDFGNKAVGTSIDNNYSTANPDVYAKIDGGAVVLCGSLVGQYGRGSDSTRVASVYVDGEGTVVTAATMKVAQYNGVNNVFEIRNGAKVVLTGTENRSLSIGGNAATNSYSNGNLLRVSSGASVERNTSASASNPFFHIGSAGSNNRLSIESGGTVKLAAPLYFGHFDNASGNKRVSNRIDVTGANSLLKIGSTYCGNANGVAASAGSSNNVAYVTDGGTLSGNRWYLYGHDNGIVVSNGTVTLAEGGIQCQISTNCFLRLQGAHSSFVSKTAGTQSEYKNGFTISFDLPEDGYDGSVAWPFVSENYTYADASFRIEVEGVEGMAKRMRRQGIDRRTVNLAKFSNGATGITDAMLAEWNAALPQLASLSYANNKLTLTVKANAPTVMTFR